MHILLLRFLPPVPSLTLPSFRSVDCWWLTTKSLLETCVYISVCVYACVCTHMQSVTHSCPILCDPMDYSLPDSCPWNFPGKNTEVGCHFLLQGSSQPRDWTHVSVSPAMAVRFFTWPQSKRTGLLKGMCSSWEACIQGLADLIVQIIRAIVTIQDNWMLFKFQWEWQIFFHCIAVQLLPSAWYCCLARSSVVP